MQAKKWTQEEKALLTEHYPTNGSEWCANKLKRTLRAVQSMSQKLGLKMHEDKKGNTRIKYTKDILEEIVKKSYSLADVIRAVGLIPQAGNYGTIKRRIADYQLDTSHFLTAAQQSKTRAELNKGQFSAKSLEEILVENSTYNSTILKKRLYDSGLKKKECELCGQGEDWHGKKIVFILDHIDGDHSNNTLINLQIVCPNCNSTLETNCSKNRKIKNKVFSLSEIEILKAINVDAGKVKRGECAICSEEISNGAKYCQKCANIVVHKMQETENRPSAEQLLKELKRMTYVSVAEKYGVACNTIRKWIRKEGKVAPKKMEKVKKVNNENQTKLSL